jgi:1-acyl-sn-glycerol-3-phosphate acyltransferase
MIGLLDRGWRLFATATSFALFGAGGLVLSATAFPLYNLLIRDRSRRERVAQQTVHATWRLYIRTMRAIGTLTYDGEGLDELRRERGVLVVANHPSLLDIVFIMSFMDRTQCVVKSGVWRNPFMRGVVKATGYIVNRGDPEQLLQDCVAAVRAGNNLVIFPEGSRTPPGVKRVYQRGFAHVALRAGVPVRLVTVHCDPPTLLKGEPWYRIPHRKPHWTIRVHERIQAPEDLDRMEPALAVRRLVSRVEQRIEEELAAT